MQSGLWKKILLFIIVAFVSLVISEIVLVGFGVESSVRAVINPIVGLAVAVVVVRQANIE